MSDEVSDFYRSEAQEVEHDRMRDEEQIARDRADDDGLRDVDCEDDALIGLDEDDQFLQSGNY